MNPLFQQTQESAFDTVLAIYGQPCIWESETGDITQTVLFNNPTEERQMEMVAGRGLNHVGYNGGEIEMPCIEFRKGQLDSLYESVYNKHENQYVNVAGKRWICATGQGLFDGQTYVLFLQESVNQDGENPDEEVVEQ